MDRLPLVPQNERNHDIATLLTETFQDTFRSNKYPLNIAENLRNYVVEDDFKDYKTGGVETIRIWEELEPRFEDILKVERELMQTHAAALIQENENVEFLEEIKLKRLALFRQLSDHAAKTYGLIQTSDLYPNAVERYLDFTYNPKLHTCRKPCPRKSSFAALVTTSKPLRRPPKAETSQLNSPFQADPDKIIFYNYTPNHEYKAKFKLRNISGTPQNFNYYPLPKMSPFMVRMLTDSCRLAPGMCADFEVIFHPTDYKPHTELIKFKTIKGFDLTVSVTNLRKPPVLICYIVNTLLPLGTVKPGNKYFSEKRRNALNFTIDCGTCLLGHYSLITVLITNGGQKGRFLLTNEDEWCWGKLHESGTRLLELRQGCFSIFPTMFEVDHGEVCQIFVAFLPNRTGLFSEKLYIICDNYAHHELDVIGDCVTFSRTFLKVHMYLVESTFSYCNRLIEIALAPFQSASFVFSVTNDSALHFENYWAIKASVGDATGMKKMGADWIKIFYNTEILPSFSTTDVVVQVAAQTEEEGLYYSYLSLFLKNIPIVSMKGTDNIVVVKNHITKNTDECKVRECGLNTAQDDVTIDDKIHIDLGMTDVHICEVNIICKVELPNVPVATVTAVSIQVMDLDKETSSRLKLSKSVLHFGLLPIKVVATDCLTVENLTNEEILWKLVEIRILESSNSLILQADAGHLSHSRGTLKKKRKRKLLYTAQSQEPVRWVSILVLFSCPSCTCDDFVLEAVCLVTYQVVQIDIRIQTDNQMNLLCPREVVYVGIPTIHTVYVHNAGLLVGCFYFLKPVGDDAHKIRLRLHPQSGTINPGCTVEVKVELIALEDGITERAYVPCFVGDPDRLISMRVICSASNIILCFYLPSCKAYDKYSWPPRSCQFAAWSVAAFGEDIKLNAEDEVVLKATKPTPTPNETLKKLITKDSVAATYPTVRTAQIQVKKPFKLTFYVENLTPIRGEFNVKSSNYGPVDHCFKHILVRAKTRTPEFFWEKECLAGYGIVIEPVPLCNDIVPYEVAEIDLWIYANTWGTYLEEIIVEINDLTPFCFNLIVEIVGLPVEFPFARNSTLKSPTIRFENIAYASETTTRCFTVTNSSAVPVQLTWHIYTPTSHTHEAPFNIILEIDDNDVALKMAREFYGCEACRNCIRVQPFDFILEKQEVKEMKVMVSAGGYVSSKDESRLKFVLIGFMGLGHDDKFKENYFRRDYGSEAITANVDVLVTLESPKLVLEATSDDTKIDLFVNDILLENAKWPEVYLLLRNVDNSVIHFSVNIDKPFEIMEARTLPAGDNVTENLMLQRQECLQMLVTSKFSHDEFFHYADLIYKHDSEDICQNKEFREEEFVSVIKKDLNIFQKGVGRQMIPFQIHLHFPCIVVKPSFVKFGQCLLYRTKKTVFSVYNMTGSTVRIEIFKSTKHDAFEVVPNNGKVARSTGVNKQFMDFALYFTPRHCKNYQESIRVATNIPQCYVDIIMGGVGTTNEKFHVE